jgi:hypothetical protein
MDNLKIYLETTMFSFYYEERQNPWYALLKEQTRNVFSLLKAGNYRIYSSVVTVRELIKEPNLEKRAKMPLLISEFNIILLEETEESRKLAKVYLQEKVVPGSELIDASHIAIATVNGLDFIMSLNFEHMARPWTTERVRQINLREGYKPIGIYKPMEALELL